jgi:uncharacterized cupin superfamily protein
VSSVVNVHDVPLRTDPSDPPGFQSRFAKLGALIGGSMLGATLYELAQGESGAPYHYEVGNEEWLLVLEGRPTIRVPDGEEELEPGDVVCFPDGPDGAHKVSNERAETARVVIFSTKVVPCAYVYPDSGKIGVNPLDKYFRVGDAVDYWVGEVPEP